MLNILVCCANGAGTSLMMKMTTEKVVKSLGIKVGKLHHCSLSELHLHVQGSSSIGCPCNRSEERNVSGRDGRKTESIRSTA